MSTNLYKNVDSSYIQSGNNPSSHQQKNGFKKRCYIHVTEHSEQRKGANHGQVRPMHESKKHQAEAQESSLRSQNGGHLCGEWHRQGRDTVEFREVTRHCASCSRRPSMAVCESGALKVCSVSSCELSQRTKREER